MRTIQSSYPSYLSAVEQVKANLTTLTAQTPRGSLNHRLELECEANLRRFFPNRKLDYKATFEKVMFNRELAVADEDHDYILDDAIVKGDMTYLKPGAPPVIFTTFHFGSYRLANFLILEKGRDFTLVIDNTAMSLQGHKFAALFDKIRTTPRYTGDFKMLNAEKQHVGIKMVRTLREGRNLLLYMDGNTGVGGMERRDEKMLSVNLLGQRIFARKGISYIGYRTKTPIVPIYAYRDELGRNVIEVLPAIKAEAGQSAADFCQQTTQTLYDQLAIHLQARPSQWEGWLYVQKFVDVRGTETIVPAPAQQLKENDLRFNNGRYVVYEDASDQSVLFDRSNYQYFNISTGLHHVLHDTQENGRLRYAVGEQLLSDLYQRNVLIASA